EDPDGGIRRHPGNLDERGVADRIEDAAVATAVRAQLLVSVGVVMVVLTPALVGRARRGFPQRDHRTVARDPATGPAIEPPAMAGRRRTSSAAATGVDSPPR